jgi:hypothetical protein
VYMTNVNNFISQLKHSLLTRNVASDGMVARTYETQGLVKHKNLK